MTVSNGSGISRLVGYYLEYLYLLLIPDPMLMIVAEFYIGSGISRLVGYYLEYLYLLLIPDPMLMIVAEFYIGSGISPARFQVFLPSLLIRFPLSL